MDYNEPTPKFRSLDKVRILLHGTHRAAGVHGPCYSLNNFDQKKDWHYIDFGKKPQIAIIIHDIQPEGILIESGRGGRKARLRYSQLIVFTGEWTISLPEYALEKVSSIHSWRGIRTILGYLGKLTRSLKR